MKKRSKAKSGPKTQKKSVSKGSSSKKSYSNKRDSWKKHVLARPLFYIVVVFTMSAMAVSIMSHIGDETRAGMAYASLDCGDGSVAYDEICDPPGSYGWYAQASGKWYDCSEYEDFSEVKLTCSRSCNAYEYECYCLGTCGGETVEYICTQGLDC